MKKRRFEDAVGFEPGGHQAMCDGKSSAWSALSDEALPIGDDKNAESEVDPHKAIGGS